MRIVAIPASDVGKTELSLEQMFRKGYCTRLNKDLNKGKISASDSSYRA